ncbi:unnamed protein product [Choristocarpus tenellus]
MASSGSWLVDLIMQPGSSTRLVPMINITLVGLLLVLIGLAVTGQGSIHILIMGFLATGLMASVNWFISEFNKVKQEKEQTKGSGAANTVPGEPIEEQQTGVADRAKSD